MIKALIFDMYGVIMKQNGYDFLPFVRKYFPDITTDFLYPLEDRVDLGEITSDEMLTALGFEGDTAAIGREYLDTIELNAGFREFIAAAGQKYKLAILSNDSASWSGYIRGKHDIDRHFDVISVSGELKIAKPDERIFLMTAEKLGVMPEECIYVDDIEKNLKTAAKIGMNAILMKTNVSGYQGTAVRNFSELSELLEGSEINA